MSSTTISRTTIANDHAGTGLKSAQSVEDLALYAA